LGKLGLAGSESGTGGWVWAVAKPALTTDNPENTARSEAWGESIG
jgi:hypothetical protein